MGYADEGSEHAKLVLENLDRDIARWHRSNTVHARFNFFYICAALAILFSLYMLMGELGYREGYTGPQWAARRNRNSNYYDDRYEEGGMYRRPSRNYYYERDERGRYYSDQPVYSSDRQRERRWR